MQQKGTKWEPNANQCKVLDVAQKAGMDRTITKVCEEAKVNRTTFYRWMKNDPGFAVAWDQVWRLSIAKHLPAIVSAQISKARKGDTPAAKLIADMSGTLKQRHEFTGPDGGPLRFIETFEVAHEKDEE